MKKVFIGVGHGGSDPGAVANGLKEANINLQMALELKRQLERHGVAVGVSRVIDENDPLAEEIKEANAFVPDLAIDVHNNAGGGDGFEVYTQTNKYKAQSLSAAKAVEAAVKAIGQNSRGVKTRLNLSGTDYFGFLRQINAPSILTEGAFIDNKADVAQIDELYEQKAFGKAYAKGILSYLGIAWKEEGTVTTSKPIIAAQTATVSQAVAWAKSKGTSDVFISLAQKYWDYAADHGGINPVVAFCQAALETGYGKYGGIIDETYCNPCGLKTKSGGSDTDKNAHQRFISWEDGVKAHLDHLALYAGAAGYPRSSTSDPRHFSYIAGKCKTVEALGGSWAPSVTYGTNIASLMKSLEATKANEKPTDNSPDEYAKQAVAWAIENSILKGDDSGNLALHSTVTRQDTIVFMKRLLDLFNK